LLHAILLKRGTSSKEWPSPREGPFHAEKRWGRRPRESASTVPTKGHGEDWIGRRVETDPRHWMVRALRPQEGAQMALWDRYHIEPNLLNVRFLHKT